MVWSSIYNYFLKLKIYLEAIDSLLKSFRIYTSSNYIIKIKIHYLGLRALGRAVRTAPMYL